MPMALESGLDGQGLFWFATNALTSIAYLAISLSIVVSRPWLLPVEYRPLFAAFIFWCGIHHGMHALMLIGIPTFFQSVADTIMTVVSVITAVIVISDERG